MSLNKIMLIGYLGRDPEVRYTRSGDAVANFSIATNERWRDKQGEMQEKTEWHNCVVWRKQAELVQNYLHKGSRVYVEGRVETREWVDKENIKRYTKEVKVNAFQFLDRKEEGGGGGSGASYGRRSTLPPRGDAAAAPQGHAREDEPYIDDDIPF